MKNTLLLIILLFIHSTSLHATTYRYVDQALIVDSLLERIDKNATVIDENAYQKAGKGLFEVTLTDDTKAPEVVYLKKTIQWLYQTPAPGTSTSNTNIGTLTLTSKTGTGRVEVKTDSGWQELTSLQLPSGIQVRTTKGSVAHFSAPGLDALHLDEESEMQFTQEKTTYGVTSEVNLFKGTSFVRTLKLEDEAGDHDFKIRSPLGLAAARGTEYLVSYQDGVSVTCIVQGGVDVNRTNGESVAQLNVKLPGDLLFQAIPELSARQYSEWLYNMVVKIGAQNTVDAKPRTFTAYLPVVRKDSHLKSFWEAADGGRIKW